MNSKAIERTDRPERLTPNSERNRLTVTGLDTKNFYHRWVNEENVERFLDKGYTFVPKRGKKLGDVIDANTTDSKSSNMIRTRLGQNQFLMKLPLELYHLDREEIEKMAHEQITNALRDARSKADYGKVTLETKDTPD